MKHMSHLTQPILALAFLAAPSMAQRSFDLILPTSVSLSEVGPFGVVGGEIGFGAIVNTGTEPLVFNGFLSGPNWAFDSRLCGRTATPWAPFTVNTQSGSNPLSTIGPGEVFGILSPDMAALLQPGEQVTDTLFPFRLAAFDDAPTGGPATDLNCLLSSQWFDPTTDERLLARFDLQVNMIPGTSSLTSGAQRISSSSLPDPTQPLNIGCGTTSFGTSHELNLLGGTSNLTELSIGCRIPVPGASLILRPVPIGGSPYVGAPWLLALSAPGGSTSNLLGCEVLTPVSGLLSVSLGTFPTLNSVGLSIPDNPSLLGASLDSQWAVFSTTAPNGLFEASRGIRLRVVSI